jgi:hypothetical protein
MATSLLPRLMTALMTNDDHLAPFRPRVVMVRHHMIFVGANKENRATRHAVQPAKNPTYLPFLVIDMVVASVLMSLGMMMLPPSVVSLPFKLIFFVLVEGWRLVSGSLVQSFTDAH